MIPGSPYIFEVAVLPGIYVWGNFRGNLIPIKSFISPGSHVNSDIYGQFTCLDMV